MTEIRPELSEKNPYWISKHRYYELKHFCMQYNEWVREVRDLTYFKSSSVTGLERDEFSNPTYSCVERIEELNGKIARVRKSAKSSGDDLWEYLLIGVTEGLTYSKLRARTNIPCCKDTYYDMYRRFFYILAHL